MSLSVKTLITEVKREEILAEFISVGATLGLTTTAFQDGEPIQAVLVIFSDRIASLWNERVVPWMRAKYLDYAYGDLLTLRAWTDYKRYRSGSTHGTASLIVENRGGQFLTITPGKIRVRNSAGKTFTNTTGGTLTPWLGAAFPTLEMVFQADEAGSGSNTAPGGIMAYPTPLVQGNANAYARTNTAAFQGSDAEKDPLLKERCRISTGPLSPGGPRRSYESIALDVRRNVAGDPVLPDPIGGDAEAYKAAASLNITRVRVLEPGNNVVRVLLASPTGAAGGDNTTPTTDVFIANTAMQLYCCPAGMTLIVEPAVELPVTIGTITLYVDADALVTKEEAEADALAALTELFNTFPIGGTRKVAGSPGVLYKGTVERAAGASNSAIYEVDANSFSDTAVAGDRVVVPSYTVNAVLVSQK